MGAGTPPKLLNKHYSFLIVPLDPLNSTLFFSTIQLGNTTYRVHETMYVIKGNTLNSDDWCDYWNDEWCPDNADKLLTKMKDIDHYNTTFNLNMVGVIPVLNETIIDLLSRDQSDEYSPTGVVLLKEMYKQQILKLKGIQLEQFEICGYTVQIKRWKNT